MTIQQLQYVVALDTYRHFVKASESCHVAQPTLTLQVKKLEKEISTELFDRSTMPIQPTDIGKKFILKARDVLNEVEELKLLVNNDRDEMEGEFRIGIIPTLSSSLLPLFLRDFMKSHPKTKLIIDEMESESIMDKIENKQIDVGILSTPLNEPNIREICMFYEPFLVYADLQNDILSGESLVADDLSPDGLWILRNGHCFRNHVLNFCQFDLRENAKNLTMEGGSIETLKKLVQRLLGYTLVPELSIDKKRDQPHIRRFKDPQPVREVSLITHKHFTKKRFLNELRKSILDKIPDNFKKNGHFKPIKWRG